MVDEDVMPPRGSQFRRKSKGDDGGESGGDGGGGSKGCDSRHGGKREGTESVHRLFGEQAVR